MVCYLSGTLGHDIYLRKLQHAPLHAFSDADWIGDSDDYVSTNRYIIFLGQQPVSWASKKQKGVARSSTEVEYRGVANTSAELRWISSLLTKIGVHIPTTPTLYSDNIGATYLCQNPVFHSRIKHIVINYHFVHGKIQQRQLPVAHVSTHEHHLDTSKHDCCHSESHHLEGACKPISIYDRDQCVIIISIVYPNMYSV